MRILSYLLHFFYYWMLGSDRPRHNYRSWDEIENTNNRKDKRKEKTFRALYLLK
jgi:hypothetical protein